MVDFKKILEHARATRSEAENALHDSYKALEKANQFLVKNTEVHTPNGVKDVEVRLHRRVHWNEVGHEVGDYVLLDFGSPRNYNFSQRFITEVTERLEESGQDFHIDFNKEWVCNQDMLGLIKECEAKVLELGIEIDKEGY